MNDKLDGDAYILGQSGDIVVELMESGFKCIMYTFFC